MSSEWLFLGFLIASSIAAIDIIRRAFVEVIALERRQALEKAMRRLRKPVQPWVTVLVSGARDSDAFTVTSRSLEKSRYHYFDVVKLYTSYQSAYRRSKRGKIVIILEAGQTVDRAFLKRAVASRSAKQQWWVELLPATEMEQGLINITSKLHAILRLKNWSRVRVYSERQFKKIKIFKHTYRETLPLAEIALLGLVTCGIVFGGALGFLYGWAVSSTYLLALIWIQYGTSFDERLKLSYSSISALFFLPIASLFKGYFQLRKRKL
jgi:hypothetical protein